MSTPRRGRRSVSESVRHLHNTLTKILSDEERSFFIYTLNQYQQDRDVQELVVSLKSVLNSPRKREVYPILRDIIPSRDRDYFDRNWKGNRAQFRPDGISSTRSRSRSPTRSPRHLRRTHRSSSLPENLNKYDSGIDLPNYNNGRTPRSTRKYPIRKLHIKRPANRGFGFCIRGGSEHGVGLYVSSVDKGSIAEVEGLLPGDHILTINDIKFDGLSHAQAVKIIRNSKKLNINVRSVGRIPNTFLAEATYKWIDPHGKQITAPPTVDSSGRALSTEGIHKSGLRLLGDDDEKKVNVFVNDGCKLGLKIRGGSEYGLGIYIAGVDVYSAADRAGLKCGDQIMDVNGTSFLDISHNNAIKVLKANKNMMVTIKDVGRLPLAKTTMDQTKWSKGGTANGSIPKRHTLERSGHWGMRSVERPEKSKFQHGIAGTQLIYNGSGPSTKNLTAEQARQVLNENELGTMTYYMDEYDKGFITVDAFVLALFDLFNSPAKVSLLSEIRGAILPKDIDRFDDLVLKREIEAMKARKTLYTPEDTHSIHSYNSSLSSFSGPGSVSSRSSAKESHDDADSRPITPPRVPDVLPQNIKITDDLPYPPVPWPHNQISSDEMNGDETRQDSDTSLPPPPPECDVIEPLFTSSPLSRDTSSGHNKMTNGDATTNVVIGDNCREDDTKTWEGKSSATSVVDSTLDKLSPRKAHSRHRHLKPSRRDSRSSKHSYEFIVNGDTPSTQSPERGTFSAVLDHEDPNRTLEDTSSSPHQTLTGTSEHRRTSPERVKHRDSGNSPTRGNSKQTDLLSRLKKKEHHSRLSDLRPGSGELSGMLLAMETNAADRSGLERSTGWGDDKNPMYELCNISVTEVTQERGPPRVTNGTNDNRIGVDKAVDNPNTSSFVSDKGGVERKSKGTETKDVARLGSRRGSGTNRKSWDGVRTPEEEEANLKISTLEQKRTMKSSSDSNLMNLPKEQQKSIQTKLKASQELYDLHQQSKNKIQDALNNNHTRDHPMEPSNHASAYEVEMEKSGVGMGLSIDGGCDTQLSAVRIKQIRTGDYAAYNCGKLKAGQAILEINGQSVEGMTNGIATLTMRLAYSDPDTSTVRLLVADPDH